MRVAVVPLLVAIVMAFPLAGAPSFSAAAETQPLLIGYLEFTDDPRYDEKRAYARIRVRPHNRPRPGAEMAISESHVLGRALKMKFSLERGEAKTAAGLISMIERMVAAGVRYFLIDADAAMITALGAATMGWNLLLFNISEPADALRGAECRAQVMHVIPSHAMMTDALAQFLVARKWRKVLVLKGPEGEDAAFAAADDEDAPGRAVRHQGNVDQHLVIDEFVGLGGLDDAVQHQDAAPGPQRAIMTSFSSPTPRASSVGMCPIKPTARAPSLAPKG